MIVKNDEKLFWHKEAMTSNAKYIGVLYTMYFKFAVNIKLTNHKAIYINQPVVELLAEVVPSLGLQMGGKTQHLHSGMGWSAARLTDFPEEVRTHCDGHERLDIHIHLLNKETTSEWSLKNVF